MVNIENHINSLFIAGKFDDHKGCESKIAKIIYDSMGLTSEVHNGGNFSQLEQLLDDINRFNMIFWFADIPNDKKKIVKTIKQRNNAHILVTSKRNIGGKYDFPELIAHALNIKSNLFVEFSTKDDIYLGRVIDPLGNVFLDYNNDMELVGKVLAKRVRELYGFKRVPSKNQEGIVLAPSDEEFFGLARIYANRFHDLIHAGSNNRFLGNLSFRCENGFPSYRREDLIYVSRRNVDKRDIHQEAFVPVKVSDGQVEYFGDNKPSVDTPIQIRLYNFYKNARYMLHSHTYIQNAPFTKNIIPCGAVEEADEIMEINPDTQAKDFFINLKGHGSLAIISDLQKMRNIPYIPRILPEVHPEYSQEFLV